MERMTRAEFWCNRIAEEMGDERTASIKMMADEAEYSQGRGPDVYVYRFKDTSLLRLKMVGSEPKLSWFPHSELKISKPTIH
jgi:hypothetical protein